MPASNMTRKGRHHANCNCNKDAAIPSWRNAAWKYETAGPAHSLWERQLRRLAAAQALAQAVGSTK